MLKEQFKRPLLNLELQERHFVEFGKKVALGIIERDFERTPLKENILPYHNREHTIGVVRRVEQILQVIQKTDSNLVTQHDINIAMIAASFHDVVQNWEYNHDKSFENRQRIMRKRLIGVNEENSFEIAKEFILKINTEAKREIFTEADLLVLKEAINVTIPKFDLVNKTVIQPNLNSESNIVATALALADLGGIGIEGHDAFGKEGDAVFREDNLDILNALEGKSEEIQGVDKEFYRRRMLDWFEKQIFFAKGRRESFVSEIKHLPENIQIAVKNLFSQFDDAIEKENLRKDRRQSMSFEELAKDMGYNF